MKLQNQDKQAELEQLIGNLNVSNQVFYEIQDNPKFNRTLAMKGGIYA